MSGDVDELAGRLAELQGERAALATTRTRDDAERAAKDYVGAVRATHAELGGFVIGGAIIGDPLNSLLTAYIVSQPEFEAFLRELARGVCDGLSDRQRDAKLQKLDDQIGRATAELREARKREAFAQIEAEFAGAA